MKTFFVKIDTGNILLFIFEKKPKQNNIKLRLAGW